MQFSSRAVLFASGAIAILSVSCVLDVVFGSSDQQSSGTGPSQAPPTGNIYCSPSGAWIGSTTDGPAQMPMECMYTALEGTPSAGEVRGPHSTTAEVQAAIDAAGCGDNILVAAGSTLSPIILPAKKCDNKHWITISSTGVSSPDFPPEGTRMTPCWSGVAALPDRPAYACPKPEVLTFKIVTPNAASGIASRSGDHYRIIGAEITRVSKGGVAIYNLVDLTSRGTQTNNIIFDRCWFEGIESKFPAASQSLDTSTTRGLFLAQSNHVAIVDSYFTNFYDTGSRSANGNTDAQCIGGGIGSVANSGWGVYKFVNNHCEGAAEGILLGGGGSPALTPSGCTITVNCNLDVPTDIEVRQNYFFKPLSWNGNTTVPVTVGWPVAKNGFEMKIGARALFEGNVIENTWYSAQGGACWVMAPKNQSNGVNPGGVGTAPTALTNDFTYRYNYCYNASYGIGLFSSMDAGCGSCQSQGANRISIHDNVIGDGMNLGNLKATSTGDAIEILATNDSTGKGLNKLQNFNISHNTFVKTIRSMILFGGPSNNTQIVNLTMQDNIGSYGNYGWVAVGGPCETSARGSLYVALNNCATNWAFDHNALFGGNGGTLGAKWPTNGRGSANFFHANSSRPGFTSYDKGNSNFNPGVFQLTPSSPLHNAASDGRDVGADITALLTRISGVRE